MLNKIFVNNGSSCIAKISNPNFCVWNKHNCNYFIFSYVLIFT